MSTNRATGILQNVNLRLGAVLGKVNGKPFVTPGLVADPTTEPNPSISDDLANQIAQAQSTTDQLIAWAEGS